MKLKGHFSSDLDKGLSHKTTRCCRKRVFGSSVLFAIVATLSACSSPSQTETQPRVESAANAQTPEAEVAPSQANTSFTQTNQHSTPLLQGVSASVYKDANCGCCTEWISYANKAGLQSTYQHPEALSVVKDRYAVPQQMRSCHTTVTNDGYVFEGHIPAKFMAQFLENPPSKAIGLAVPSMPVGSPGMEYKGKFMPYKIFQLNKDGSYEEFAAVDTPQQQL
ncbi:DUF411 domain-containing protein [Psychrobacter sanguinis]|uniref:DUF411 domain-containing protein n=1 Tax=Psychrobacter sanguinis TaxID=861445 RepID=UPI001918B089|nr:DUF411 domain-containing protein [Psychrobacter sanguinis]MCC3307581.1 DUF411 domain-containing protein [Psychrobacter sanguinis]UEC24912.1 DUF411 domain-containing protein [Psychrobacter sanguinis]